MKRLLIAIVAGGVAFTGTGAGAAQADSVTVMTRNLYLGAGLRPLFAANDMSEVSDLTAKAVREALATNFPTRAKGLAEEIQARKPDLVGVQEAAVWRRGPVDVEAVLRNQPQSEEMVMDYLELLMTEVNKGPVQYEVADVRDQRDMESIANMDGNPNTGPFGADANYRLTLRNAILVRSDADVQITGAQAAHYKSKNTLRLRLGNRVTIKAIRGWHSVRAKVGDSPWFTFANTHFEALDSQSEVPSVRARQAKEFARAMKAVSGPVVTVGDLNSDVRTNRPGDHQAYKVLMAKGFVDIGTRKPASCCIQSSADLRNGSASEFRNRVDQILTPTPKRVKKVKAWVVGRSQSFGYWHSDHAGIVSKLDIR